MNKIKFLLKSLFSNAEVANNGKKQKWWLTFIVLILSLGLAVLPNIISVSNTNGDQYITNYTSYNIDYSLERLSIEYLNGNDTKIDLLLNDDNELIQGEKTISSLPNAKSVKVNETDVYYFTIGQADNVTMVVTYVESSNDFDAVEEAIVLSGKVSSEEEEKYISYSYNTLLLSKTNIQLSIYNNNTVVSLNEDGTALSGDLSPVATFQGNFTNISSQYRNLANLNNQNTPNLTIENWKNFFSEAYAPLKTTTLIYSSILYLGLNIMVILVMALTTFIMSRFKSSLCDKLKFSEALQSIIFLALCPGILSFIVYYIFPGLQSMAFFLFLALRSIFFTTKLTRGDFKAQQASK